MAFVVAAVAKEVAAEKIAPAAAVDGGAHWSTVELVVVAVATGSEAEETAPAAAADLEVPW